MKKNKVTARSSALGIFYRVLSICSTRCLFRIAKFLSYIVLHTNNQLSVQTRKNIKLCFAELNSDEQENLVNDSLHHTACAFFELAALWHKSIEEVLSYVKTRQVDDSFYNKNRAKIIIAPHHGSWELLNLWLANEGTLYSLYKPAKSSKLEQYVLNNRSRNGAILVPANTTGLRSLLQGLKNKASCMILPDQRPAKNTAQINAPFYNHSAPTSLLIKRLASKVDCDIFIASVTRDLRTANYHLVIKSLNREKFLSDDLNSASYLNRKIQDLISKDISQYQWAYRRFPVDTYLNY